MHVQCTICSDIFNPQEDIRSPKCGHLFHCHCLQQWLRRSHTCPQCRSKTTMKSVRKIYFSIEETPEEIEAGTLQNELDNLKSQMTLKENDINIAKEKYQTQMEQNVKLRKELQEQENKSLGLESAIHALEEHANKLQDENERLKHQSRNLENIHTVLAGTDEQVNGMLKNNLDPQSLAMLVLTLKKELMNSDKIRTEIETKLKETQKESKNCLYKREQHASNSKDESPNPVNSSQITTLSKLTNVNYESPSIPETVQVIKDSKSPFLQFFTSVIGYSGLGNYNGIVQPRPSSVSTITHNKNSTIKQSRKTSEPSSCDGLGGHAKEEFNPSPITPKTNLKRQKTSSTTTSAKCKKLAHDSEPNCAN